MCVWHILIAIHSSCQDMKTMHYNCIRNNSETVLSKTEYSWVVKIRITSEAVPLAIMLTKARIGLQSL